MLVKIATVAILLGWLSQTFESNPTSTHGLNSSYGRNSLGNGRGASSLPKARRRRARAFQHDDFTSPDVGEIAVAAASLLLRFGKSGGRKAARPTVCHCRLKLQPVANCVRRNGRSGIPDIMYAARWRPTRNSSRGCGFPDHGHLLLRLALLHTKNYFHTKISQNSICPSSRRP